MRAVTLVVMIALIVASIVFIVQGVQLHAQAASEQADFEALQAEYYSFARSVRDVASSGSSMNERLVRIEQYPSKISSLQMLGLAKMVLGVFCLLFAIFVAVFALPVRSSVVRGRG